MFGIKRRRKVPAGIRPTLDRDERVVTWARTTGPSGTGTDSTGAVVVTTRGVFLPGRERLAWHEIHKATWANPRLTVVPGKQLAEGEGYLVMVDDTPVVVGLSGPDDVPDQVRQRVTKSVAFTHYQPLPGGGVRVVGRRVAGRNGLIWHVRYDEGTDTADPTVVAYTAELVAEAAKPDDPEL